MEAKVVKLDDVDISILRALQENGRRSYRELAKRLGVSIGTVHSRVRSLIEKGVIKGFSAVIDPSKVGYDLTALILIQADGRHLVEVENEIAKSKNVYAVYDVTGEFDAAVIARFKDRASLNTFIKSILALPYVRRSVTSVVLNVVREDMRVSL